MQTTMTKQGDFKKSALQELKLKQLKYESHTWNRLLEFMMDENIHLKDRLSEILKEKFDKYLLEEVDNFQSRFIKEDDVIGLLRNELAEYDQLLEDELFADEKISNTLQKKIKILRNNITIAEEHFGKLKSEFNTFLSDNIL